MGAASSPNRFRVRLVFEKTAAARHLSHADSIRVWERSFRRAGVPLAYSGGFAPRPQIRFGPPVPVGYEAHEELLDAILERPVDGLWMIGELNRSLPEGLRVRQALQTGDSPASLMSSARSAVYEVSLASPPADLGSRISAFLAMETAPVQVQRRLGGGRTLDLRPEVLDLSVSDAGALRMVLRLGHGAACRPEDVAAALGLSASRIVRLSVRYDFGVDGDRRS